MLIDSSYFFMGPRHIQNASSGDMPHADSIRVNNVIREYVKSFQESYLIMMLGYDTGRMVNKYLIESDGYCEKRAPILEAVCNQLKESFADYVFYQILKFSVAQATITGLVRLKSANDYVSPIRQQVNIWNNMVERHRQFVLWCLTEECRLKGIMVSEHMLTKINVLNL